MKLNSLTRKTKFNKHNTSRWGRGGSSNSKHTTIEKKRSFLYCSGLDISHYALSILLVSIVLACGSIMILPQAIAATDYDTDDDRLIEIDTPEKLQVVKYDLDGNGTADSVSFQDSYRVGFPDSDPNQCPDSSCIGYELVTDIRLGLYRF